MTMLLHLLPYNNIWFVNVGTKGPNVSGRRVWVACREYGFVSAGQGEKYKRDICKPDKDDIICAYENMTGFIGIGKVESKAVMIKDFRYKGQSLQELPLVNKGTTDNGLFENQDNHTMSEYAAKIVWFDLTPNPLWIGKGMPGFYAPRLTVSRLEKKDTLFAIEKHFAIRF